jgi:hypothetical protein
VAGSFRGELESTSRIAKHAGSDPRLGIPIGWSQRCAKRGRRLFVRRAPPR